jgi:hypothetical protein
MSAENSIRTGLEQRFQNICKMPLSQKGPIVFENFAHDCRFAAMQLAYKGNFQEAFSIASLLDSIWETPSDCTSFYVGIAKAILIQQQQDDALSAIRGDERRIKSLQQVVRHLSPSASARLLVFLAKCKQHLYYKL